MLPDVLFYNFLDFGLFLFQPLNPLIIQFTFTARKEKQ